MKMEINNSPVVSQLLKNEATTIALAKMLLSKEKFEEFLQETSKQFVYSLKEFIEIYPAAVTDQEELAKALDEKIKSFEPSERKQEFGW